MRVIQMEIFSHFSYLLSLSDHSLWVSVCVHQVDALHTNTVGFYGLHYRDGEELNYGCFMKCAKDSERNYVPYESRNARSLNKYLNTNCLEHGRSCLGDLMYYFIYIFMLMLESDVFKLSVLVSDSYSFYCITIL